jgi:hypothetical protein
LIIPGRIALMHRPQPDLPPLTYTGHCAAMAREGAVQARETAKKLR